jgi:cellulose synthase/poly-beta-1,6-N-acetylglucosamine synthase-like glycosyltransferase
MLVIEILLWLSMVGMFLTYLAYPLFMIQRARSIKQVFSPIPAEKLPTVQVIFAAFNEEAVLEPKIRSVLASKYPAHKLSIAVGSDNSTDDTNAILKKLQTQFPNQIVARFFKTRHGKSAIINKLAAQSQAQFLLLTDANIIFNPFTVNELVKGAYAPKTGACGGQIKYPAVSKKGIAQQENTYLNLENKLKLAESKIWHKTMGLEGGCYLIKRELFPQIPPNFFMEDFFVTLSVLQKNYAVRFNPAATVTEDVSTLPQEEFKRKVRISIGNFQNLNYFKSLILQRFWPLGFSFLMHKVLRWLTPFLMLICFSCLMVLMFTSFTYQLMALGFMVFLCIGYAGILFSQGLTGTLIKYPGHFIYMNLALLKGFVQYTKGVKSNAWQPTARNQS